MKTILLNVILSLVLAGPAFSARPVIHVHSVEGKAAIFVQLANLEKARTEVFLKTIDGRLQYSGFISGKNGHTLQLTLDGMEEGAYLLGVSNKATLELRAFLYTSGNINFFEEQGGAAVSKGLSRNVSQPLGEKDPVIASITAADKGALINVQLSNLRSKPVHTRIISLTGISWHEETEEARNGFSRNYITEGLPDGPYYLYVKAGATQLVQFFTVEGGGVVLGSLQRAEAPGGSRS